MGPRRWSRGRRRRHQVAVDGRRASMGPRRWSRGRRTALAFVVAAGMSASMGPRQWSRGRRRQTQSSRSASMQLQWGHDDGVVEDVTASGPAAPVRPRFNGATTMESWKTMRDRSTRSPLDRASMGPRRWSRGRRGDATLYQRGPGDRFNGATTMESWKTATDGRVGAAARISFNGATTMSRGRPDRALDDRGRDDRRFNGATTVESWKTDVSPSTTD